jgi:hypothetical protein
MTGNGPGIGRSPSTPDLQSDFNVEDRARSGESGGNEGGEQAPGEPSPTQPESHHQPSQPALPIVEAHHRNPHLRIELPPRRRSRLSGEGHFTDIPLQDRSPSARNAPLSPLAGPSTMIREDEDEEDKGSIPKASSPSLSPGTPASPKTPRRARGYSLRTQLFVKNAVSTPTTASTHRRGESITSMISRHLPSRGGSDHSGDAKDATVGHSDSSTTTNGSARKKGLASTYAGILKPKTNPVIRSITGVVEDIKQRIAKYNEIPPSKNGRIIPFCPHGTDKLVDERTGQAYINNTVRSSRYTVWNFLPKQLAFQFSKLANLYELRSTWRIEG